ncbi:MAG: Hsp20/alpha crystallin family protein [Methanobrevibacter sp.]|uniref:Hsp20/alpha crystallin family protein n=1 Tax=Methanobrevibacter sp. TaxID=66852 RepID=UPI0025EF2E98|nr:Hsp20/alpha crystallin family protein [Methanobrevibacter sp.]MBQ8017324.1 Hsp20/alpha crystallin family protein [Methanobrevibacter sp.]
MVDSETIEEKISDKKEKLDEKVEEVKEKFDEKKEEQKEKFEERKEKGKNIADNVINDLYKSIDEFKENIKNMQKTADQKYADYKKSTVQTLDIDLVETKDIYYIKAAVPGVEKEDVLIEAGDNDITIETTFKPYIEEFEEDETAEVISSSIKSGRCVKTVRFENSLDLENITAKFANGIVTITIPKLIIPKHKVNVE